MKFLHSILAVLLFFSFSTSSNAAIVDIFADLQPVIGVNTIATANLTGTFDDVTGQLDYTIFHNGLDLNDTGLVFHGPVPALQNGLPDTTASAPGREFVGDVISGFTDSFIIPANEIIDVLNGFWYVDLHTVNFPNAELRGHINVVESPVPIPATAWLFISALGGLGFLRRQHSTI